MVVAGYLGSLGVMATPYKVEHPRNIPAAYHKPIGQLVTRWGITELYLQSIIWHIWKIADPKVARLLTWDLRAESKVSLFKLLSPRWITDPEQQAELKEIATKASDLREKRNRIAHGLWGHKPGKPNELRLLRIKGNTRILPTSETVSPADVKV